MTKKLKELKEMSRSEREKKIEELRMELMRSKIQTNTSKGSSKIKEIKKMIARILTLNK